MAQPFIGEIRMFAGNFAPVGWELCSGQLLPISEYDALFTLIGTTYGGDGQNTFALPDLQGRLPMHHGTLHQIGELGGVESVTLSTQQIPGHQHVMLASLDNGNATAPSTNVLATTTAATVTAYGTDAPLGTLASQTVTVVGGSQPHENTQPFLCVNFIISLFGLFPN
jgi:microcystin-dependent protein